MSTKSAKEFLDAFDADPTVQTELWEAAGAKSNQVTLPIDRLVEVAKRRGYAFSTEDIVTAYAEHAGLGKQPTDGGSELGEDQLEAISGGAVVPSESFSLNYEEIKFTYNAQEKDSTSGGVSMGYDLKANKKV